MGNNINVSSIKNISVFLTYPQLGIGVDGGNFRVVNYLNMFTIQAHVIDIINSSS